MIMDVYVWSYHQYVLYYQAVLETEAKPGSSSCLSVLIRTGDTFRRCLLEVFWPESVILQNCSNCFISLVQAKTTENNKVPNLPDLGMSNEVKCTVSWILLCVAPCLLICKGVN